MAERIERDSLGDVRIPADALWGPQTQRAVDNFPISGPMPAPFIRALAQVKWGAAAANAELGLLPGDKAAAIQAAAAAIADGAHAEAFPVDVFQTGSGTSSNMNMNEVIAHLCQQQGVAVHPNDDVNLGQSSNDSVPTALHLAAADSLKDGVLPALSALMQQLDKRAGEWADVVKTGRTHLMDAMPLTLGQELSGWVAQLQFAERQLQQSYEAVLSVPQGGTAVGTGINADPDFAARFAAALAQRSGHPLQPLASPFSGQSALDRPLSVSAALRALAVVLMKICNDLRWMNSGPIHGLAEIQLPAVQPGSSIMPGKVNPVVCESVCMIAAQTMGLDQANVIAAQSGNFQLNVMMPLMAANLVQMAGYLERGMGILVPMLAGMQANREHLAETVARNPVLVTALNPVIGYEKAADIAKEAFRTGRPVLEVAREYTDLDDQVLRQLLDPEQLTHGGIQAQ
ncbi:class II fumarate hydratase [Isoalcanivorax beigongshangi]|uniref:fumarate hydratase n=1 Tax=Isoalcanivorax beigongshangi TaxID=3238810 RepID=A0ABV4ADN5_9GAMM